LMNAVRGTASSKPITPHNQPQKRIPTVAATGPILTRLAINFGMRRFADTTCEEEDRENDDDEWYECVELKERRCKRKSKRSDQPEEGQQIQEPAGDSERYGTFDAKDSTTPAWSPPPSQNRR